MEKGAYMTKKEVDRAEVFLRIAQKRITKTQAAEELDLSLRQILRLYKDYKKHGRNVLCSKKRGKKGNRQLSPSIKEQVQDLVVRDIYAGFGPTFMCEKLNEVHLIKISRESTRKIMIQNSVWSAKSKKRSVVHQQRKRRARYGELIQIDGSPHDWFEDRGERCSLLVYIDDATGRTYGKFVEVESSAAYMDVTREYICRFGIPRCFYSDKHGIFRVNRTGCVKEKSLTQFGRALKELEIQLICASSPQAKGRVERANKTHQDRLVKELRLAGVRTIDEANKFLIETRYWDKHNEKFAIPPTSQENAHREISSKVCLEEILCFKDVRKVSKNLELQYENIIYQICPEDHLRGLSGAKVTILKKLDGTITIEHRRRKVSFREYHRQVYVGKEVNSKEIDRFLKEKQTRSVPDSHPWKRKYNHNVAA